MNVFSGTLLRRLFFSFSLVAVPVSFGLVVTTYMVEDFSRLSRQALTTMTRVLVSKDKLENAVKQLELRLKENLLLGREGFFEPYRAKHREVQKLLQAMAETSLDDELKGMIARAMVMEQGIYLEVDGRQAADDADIRLLTSSMTEFSDLIASVSGRAGDQLAIEVSRLQHSGERSIHALNSLVVGVFLLTLVLVLGFALRLSRPLAIVDNAIKQMGRGEFDKPIAAVGPKDIRALSTRLEWLRRRLKEIEDQKETFLLHMSHELKSPLASLYEGLGLLNDRLAGPLNEKQREITRILFASAHHLRTLIDNYINYHALAQPTRDERNRYYRLDELAETVLKAIRKTQLHKKLRFDVTLPPIGVFGDPEPMRLVLTNLLENAVKFSPADGSIMLRLSQPRHSVIVEVGDRGPGIPEDEKARIFEPFFQGAASRKEHLRGNGLGLSIVREHIAHLGGSIEVLDREPGVLFSLMFQKKEDLAQVA